MADQTLTAILALSFVLGLVHAFDADHVVAVSSLAQRSRSWKAGIHYAFRWAMGHGGVLLMVAIAASSFRWQLPDYVPHSAEKLVGVILIAAGLSIFWNLHKQRANLHIHRHGDIVHAHLATAEKPSSHDHSPILVGIVHGLAGSAPALALIPVSLYKPYMAVGYMLIFSVGVLAGMVTFGLLLGRFQHFLLLRSPRLFDRSRLMLGLIATALGTLWLVNSY